MFCGLCRKIWLLTVISYLSIGEVQSTRCVGIKTEICRIKDAVNDANELNITNAGDYRGVSRLVLDQRGSNVKEIPAEIFEMFPQLKRFRLKARLPVLSKSAFLNARELLEIEFADNLVEAIPSEVFAEVPKVQSIDLSSNRIAVIENQAFAGLAQLEYIYLDDNRLTALHRSTFKGAEKLRILQLENNEIETLEDGTFDFPELRYIFLGFNKIQTLSDGIFANTPNLFGLDLKGNNLSRIGAAFSGCSQLDAVVLDHNRIEDIDLESFANLTSLQQLSLKSSGFKFPAVARVSTSNSSVTYLDLSHNGISNVDVFQRLASFGRVEELHLENNNLTTIEGVREVRRIFPNLNVIALSDNQLGCDWVHDTWKVLRSHKIAVSRSVDDLSQTQNVHGIVCK